MESEELNTRVGFYLEAFDLVRKRVGDDQIAASIVEQVGKDVRTRLLMEERREKGASNSDDPDTPTPKQLEYLRDLGVDVPEGTTKQRASEMIDDAKAAGL